LDADTNPDPGIAIVVFVKLQIFLCPLYNGFYRVSRVHMCVAVFPVLEMHFPFSFCHCYAYMNIKHVFF